MKENEKKFNGVSGARVLANLREAINNPLMAPKAAANYLGLTRGEYAGLLRRNREIPVELLTGQRVRRVRRNVLDQLLVKGNGVTR